MKHLLTILTCFLTTGHTFAQDSIPSFDFFSGNLLCVHVNNESEKFVFNQLDIDTIDGRIDSIYTHPLWEYTFKSYDTLGNMRGQGRFHLHGLDEPIDSKKCDSLIVNLYDDFTVHVLSFHSYDIEKKVINAWVAGCTVKVWSPYDDSFRVDMFGTRYKLTDGEIKRLNRN